ncbi:MAG: branched-chain amino acid ABC transporter ATP-binding protein/permease [Actinomycetota bacterium]|jgi:ABC-type branched-subunit amino acid transport system ATPase component/ABC-type branched-subunit amino acid transport system permease subunit
MNMARAEVGSKRRVRAALAGAAVLAVAFGLSEYWLYVVNLGLIYAVVAGSLVILTGWTGQVSLAQASFMGISAYVVVALHHHYGIPFVFGAPVAVLATVPFTVIVGFVALRLSGFHLAAATVAFALAVQRFVFQFRELTGGSSGYAAPPLRLFGWDLDAGRSFFFVLAAVAAVLAVAAWRLRSSSVGRAWAAIRTSERAARSLGIDVARYKLAAFVVSGVVAGIGGVLYAVLLERLSPLTFDVGPSVLILSIALVGGIDHLAGALIGGMAYAFTPELARAAGISGNWVPFMLAAAMLTVIALAPAGVAGLLTRRSRRDEPVASGDIDPAALDELAARWGARPPAPSVVVDGVTVRFGGLTAVSDLSVTVPPATIVGLIGPNGAGKSTCLNVLTGFARPTRGTVHVGDRDVTAVPPEGRAAAGLARTFQTPLLFTTETVERNLLMAAHLHSARGLVGAVLRTRPTRHSERASRDEAACVLRALGLGGFARQPVGTLPFGTERLVEVARCLMTRPQVLLLDEPAAGLSGHETDRLARLVAALRDRLGITVVLVEHDIELVMALADRVDVLDFGRLIASGAPDEVQTHPEVRRAYLGVAEDDGQASREVAHAAG